MIHSAKFGSIERFLGVLVEHYAGAFPPWLAPVQVRGHPGRRAARGLPATRSPSGCARLGMRVEIDSSDDRMQKKIRNAQLQKVPFMMIAGDATSRPARCRSATATASRRTAYPSTRRSRACQAAVDRPRAGLRPDERPPGDDAGPDHAGRGGGARRARAAVDPAPDGLHLGGEQAVRRHRGDVPVLPDPGDGRRGGPGRPPRRAVLRRCSTSTPTPRATSWSAPSATSRATRPDRGGDRRGRPPHPAGDAGGRAGQRRPRLQHRHEPGRRSPAPASPPTCTSTSCRAGAGTQNFMPIIGRTKTLPQLLGRDPTAAGRGVVTR